MHTGPGKPAERETEETPYQQLKASTHSDAAVELSTTECTWEAASTSIHRRRYYYYSHLSLIAHDLNSPGLYVCMGYGLSACMFVHNFFSEPFALKIKYHYLFICWSRFLKSCMFVSLRFVSTPRACLRYLQFLLLRVNAMMQWFVIDIYEEYFCSFLVSRAETCIINCHHDLIYRRASIPVC